MRIRVPKNICCVLVSLPILLQASAQGLIIPSGTYVIANNGNLVVAANWVNNGSFTHNGGAVVFAGATQTLGGSSSTTFNNLTIAAGSNTRIVSPGQKVKGVVLSNDTLNANGNLTLLSTATQTALINGSGTGEVIGNLTTQRYLPSGFGYKYFSSPFQHDTVNDFSSAINLYTSFPDLYSFNENLGSNGWVNYTNPSGLLAPLAGYAVNFGTSTAALTVSLTGVVNNHTISTALYNHNMTFTQGFNLAGNPYPSPVNWDIAGGWTKSNIDNAIYFFSAGTTDQYTGTYSSYVNGVSSNGVAGNMIAAMQGFFVHVSNGAYPVSAFLAVNNLARNTLSTTTFFGYTVPQAPSPLVRLAAGFADVTLDGDPAVFYFHAGAGGSFDKKLDALKLMNTHKDVPNLYGVSTDTEKLSIYALPDYFDSVATVPLGLKTARDGYIDFKATHLENIPPGLYVYLTDTKTGAVQDLQNAAPYQVHLAEGEYKDRFFLNFSNHEPVWTGNAAGSPAAVPFSAYGAGETLFVNIGLAPGQKGDIRVFDLRGQVILRREIDAGGVQSLISNLTPGIYLVALYTTGSEQTKKIFIGNR